MRILMISDVFFPRINGVSTSIATFRKSLQARGHEVFLIAPSYPGNGKVEPGILRIPSRYLFFDPEDRLMQSRAIQQNRRFFEQQGFDIVHIHTPFVAHYQGLSLARQLRLPAVVTYHTYFEEYLFHYAPFLPKRILCFAARHFSRSQIRSLDGMVVPSTAMLEILRAYGVNCPAEVLPTGIDLKQFSGGDGARFRQKHGIEPGRPVLLFLGRVAFEKNIEFLLHMLPAVLANIPDTLLIIAGEGPAEKRLHKAARTLGINDNVRFVGYLARDKGLLDCYRAADCFVFASRTETQGLVLLEAMAMGVPVVSTAVMGTRDILLPGQGAVIAKEQTDDFATTVVRVLQNPELRSALSAAGLQYVRKWSSDVMTDRLLDFYAGVIENASQ